MALANVVSRPVPPTVPSVVRGAMPLARFEPASTVGAPMAPAAAVVGVGVGVPPNVPMPCCSRYKSVGSVGSVFGAHMPDSKPPAPTPKPGILPSAAGGVGTDGCGPCTVPSAAGGVGTDGCGPCTAPSGEVGVIPPSAGVLVSTAAFNVCATGVETVGAGAVGVPPVSSGRVEARGSFVPLVGSYVTVHLILARCLPHCSRCQRRQVAPASHRGASGQDGRPYLAPTILAPTANPAIATVH